MARILIMEDNDGFRTMLQEMVAHAGYEVVEAADGAVGMELYRKEPYDLVILDIFMPEKEGIETIIDLRRDYPDVKIIAISGGGRGRDLQYLKIARDFGAQKTLAKPFERQELLAAIQELVGQGAQ